MLKSTITNDNNNEIQVSAKSSTLYFILKYIYTGETDLENSKSIDYDELDLFDLPHLHFLFPLLPAKLARTTVRQKHACFSWSVPKSKLTESTKLRKAFCYDGSLEWTKINLSFDVEQNFLKQNHLKFCVKAISHEEFIHIAVKIYITDSKYTMEYEHDFNQENI